VTEHDVPVGYRLRLFTLADELAPDPRPAVVPKPMSERPVINVPKQTQVPTIRAAVLTGYGPPERLRVRSTGGPQVARHSESRAARRGTPRSSPDPGS
jgi:hypothetical protein